MVTAIAQNVGNLQLVHPHHVSMKQNNIVAFNDAVFCFRYVVVSLFHCHSLCFASSLVAAQVVGEPTLEQRPTTHSGVVGTLWPLAANDSTETASALSHASHNEACTLPSELCLLELEPFPTLFKLVHAET